MSRNYDNWEKIVGAVLRREKDRQLALCRSFSSLSSADVSSRPSFASEVPADAHAGHHIPLDDTPASSRRSSFSYHVARPIELKEIRKATKDFQHDILLGRGLICQVFKAWIDEHTLRASNPESGMAVAVKICHRSNCNWLKEINYLIQLHHPGLVDFIGYCAEEENMILVYEFMPEGCLHDHLFRRHQPLPWGTRLKVAVDAGRGLSYLHGREKPVIHRDLRIGNILLDEALNAKLSNYCYGTDDPTGDVARVSTRQVIHVRGYTPPEYKSKGYLTTKSNVYTFGIILLELLTGIPTPNQKWEKHYFSKKEKLLEIMDIKLDGHYSVDAAYEVAKLALKCLSIDPRSRPSMADVVIALELLLCP